MASGCASVSSARVDVADAVPGQRQAAPVGRGCGDAAPAPLACLARVRFQDLPCPPFQDLPPFHHLPRLPFHHLPRPRFQ